jgi:glycosyltransferase involved in cell wall biosynthesis
MAHNLGIHSHITFTGRIPYRQARDYLALGDISVAPKMSSTEGSGKILNYMAMGLPTVAFETPVSRQYLREEGLYATPGDPVSLAQALLNSLSDPDIQRRKASLRNRAVETYSWDRAAGIILRAYQSVCHGQATVI